MTKLTIPNGVREIHMNAFWKNNIKELNLPSTLTLIGVNAFLSNPLESVTIKNYQENVTIQSNAFGSFDINNINWEPVEE